MKKFKLGRALLACVLAVAMMLGTCATSFAAVEDWFTDDVIASLVDGASKVDEQLEKGANALQNLKDKYGIAIEGEEEVYAKVAEICAEIDALIAVADSGDREALEDKVAEYLDAVSAKLELTTEDKAYIADVVTKVEAEVLAIIDLVEQDNMAALETKVDAYVNYLMDVLELTAEEKAAVGDVVEEVKTEIKDIVDLVENGTEEEKKVKAMAYIDFLKEVLGITAEDEAQVAELAAIVNDIAEIVKTTSPEEVKAAIDAYMAECKDAAMLELAKLGHEKYAADGDSYYVAIGGSTVAGVGVDRSDSTYSELLGDSLEIDFSDIAQERLPFAGAYDFVIANASEIAQADLITYQPDASSFVYALLADTPDWSKYINAETAAVLELVAAKTEEVLAENWETYANAKLDEIIADVQTVVYDAVVEAGVSFDYAQLDAFIAKYIPFVRDAIAYVSDAKNEAVETLASIDGSVFDYAENLAYATVAYAIDTAKIAEAIQTINPDATLLVVGMYNPLKGLEIVANGTSVDAGAMFEYVIDATNIYYTGLAAKDKGFAFVDVSDAETAGFANAINVDELDVSNIGNILLDAEDSMHATAAGHEYIKDQILVALTCDNSVYEAIDEEDHAILCAICGEAAGKEAHSFTDDVCTKCGYEVVEEEEEDKKHYGGGGGSSVIQFTIKFETNGGNAVEKVVVKSGSKLAAPTAPTKAGFDFDGWYTDKALTQKYDFDKPVTKAFTLYAKWSVASKFTDISNTAWYYDYVKFAEEKGLINGVSATEFAPTTELNRGMFVTILHRLEGTPETETEVAFTDVAEDAYYATAVAWASANGIVLGITETEFAPEKAITREQMAAIIARYVAYKEIAVTEGKEVVYTDSDAISDYAKEPVEITNWLGLLIGNTDGSFAPQRNTIRAEAAALFVRLYNTLNK